MGSSPALTVVITTRDPRRLPFLVEAVRSCSAQKAPAEAYEIVVVTAYPLEREKLPSVPVPLTVVRDSGAWQGGRIRTGSRVARGTHLVLMDDDDLFEEGKIAHVLGLLQKEPGIVYYHNECVLVDPQGAPLPGTTFHQGTTRFKGPGYFGTYDEGRKREEVGTLVRAFAFFNPSSIVVARRLVEEGASLLEQVPTAPDLVLFFLALGQPGTLHMDPAVLTRYRIHPGNDSVLTWPDMTMDFRTDVIRTLAMLRDDPRSALPPKARAVVQSMILSGSFGVAVLTGRSNQGEVSRAMWRLLRASNSLDQFTRWSSLVVAFAYMVNPPLAQWWLRKIRVRDLLAS